MPLKPFSAISYFFDYYEKKEHKSYLDYLTHIIMSYYYEESNSKELTFFPNILSVFSVYDLFKFIEFFPDCKIAIPKISKLKESRELAYLYYLVKIKQEIFVWEYDDGDLSVPLGDIYTQEVDRDKMLKKVETLHSTVKNSEEIKHYFDSLDDTNDSEFQKNLFILSTFVFYDMYYERHGDVVNYFPDIINFFGFGVVQKVLSKYQSKGNSILLKTPSLDKLRFLITVIVSYYLFYHLGIEWKRIKELIPFYLDKPKKILSNIQNMHKRIEAEIKSGGK